MAFQFRWPSRSHDALPPCLFPSPPLECVRKKLRSPRRTSFWGPNLTQACTGVLTGVWSFLNSLMWSFLNSRLNSHWLFRGGGLALLPTTQRCWDIRGEGQGNFNHHLSLPDSGWLRLLVEIFWGLDSHQSTTGWGPPFLPAQIGSMFWTLFGRRWGNGWFECVLGKPPLTHIRINLEQLEPNNSKTMPDPS